ncbi:hypothetical protein QQG55_1830 [Brugia pahangi]|uniref:Uncharacterized protein n=1 Tax=Brugia pahangi TaxID=6280 RepID=A0A0N4T2Q6_BRUPA|nr:unnamed protein product [Brugia pahangi]
MGLRLSIEIHRLFNIYLNNFIASIEECDNGSSDIDENIDSIDDNDKNEDSITDDNIWSKSGSLREFLSDYENIINNRNQLSQTNNERAGESGYRSESTTYEETISTTRYSDSAGTPEYR